MGLIDFVKTAGGKLMGAEDQKKIAQAQAQASAEAEYANVLADINASMGTKLTKAVAEMDFSTDPITVAFDGAQARAILMGKVPTQEVREKVIVFVGNHEGIAQVEDNLTVEAPEPAGTFHTVVKGDTLSKIAKAVYGDPMKYPVIFEANKPMLTDPDLIYPGQVLRIPPA